MPVFRNLWRKLTHTKALEQSSGKLETLFFESVYRVSYLMGLSTSDNNWLYFIYSTTVKLLIGLVICGLLWFNFTEPLSMEDFVGGLNVILLQVITVYRYINMIGHKDVYKKIAVSMESPNFDISTETRRNLVSFWANQNEKFLKLLLALGNCTLVAWYTFPLTDEMEYNLIVGIKLPFEYNTPLRYPFAYVMVIAAFTYVSHFVMVTDLIMQAHLIHLLCQLTVLSDCFKSLLADCGVGFEGIHQNYLIYNKSFAKKYTMRLGNLIEQHKAILGHTMSLKETLSGPMLGQFAASGTLICLIGYQTATTITTSYVKGIMSLFFLCYNAFELYIICRWCEEITVESQRVGEAIYSCGWENGMGLLPGVKSTIQLVIARAHKPVVFTAGGMYSLSLTSYSTLVKASYSALTVLLRFQHEKTL